MILKHELIKAFLDCWRTKKTTKGAIEFCDTGYLNENLDILLKDINTKTYSPGPSDCFIIEDPKPREIFAAQFRDRIVHHLIIGELYNLFEKDFIPDTYACMRGRGTLYGIKRVQSMMKKNQSDWVLKLDLKNFFVSLPILNIWESIEPWIDLRYNPDRPDKKDTIKWLTWVTLMNRPQQKCVFKCPFERWSILDPSKSMFNADLFHGLAIGNLTSQFYANFYLMSLDYYIFRDLGFSGKYGRYADDMVLVGSKESLIRASQLIRQFCENILEIKINMNKIYLQPVSHGIDFIGTIIRPDRLYTRNRTITRFIRKLETGERRPEVLNSYLRILKHTNSRNIKKRIASKYPGIPWSYEWEKVKSNLP